MNRLDLALFGLALGLAVSTLVAPAGGVGVDGRHVLATVLVALIALRGTTPKGIA